MVGSPTIQLAFGLVIGAFVGTLVGWSYHPVLGFLGFACGGLLGLTYAGAGCLLCGWAWDMCVGSLHSRQYAHATFAGMLWLAVSAMVTIGAMMIVIWAQRAVSS